MREIKFRVWDKDSKRMYSTYLGREYNCNGLSEVKFTDKEVKYVVYNDRENVSLMQFTGLKDIDDKEIYEGDIVKIFERMAGEDFIGKVIYDESEGCYWIMEGNERNNCKVTFDLESYSHNVIGNIYENPELIDYESIQYDNEFNDKIQQTKTVIMCIDSECDKYGHDICCKYCSELGNCIKEDCVCSEVNEDIRECEYAKF